MEQFFKLKEHGTTVRTELVAGFTTFMAMAYILMVNAGMFAVLEGQVTYNAVYIATAISSVIGLPFCFSYSSPNSSEGVLPRTSPVNALFYNTVSIVNTDNTLLL